MKNALALKGYDLDQELLNRVMAGAEPAFQIYPYPGRAVVAGRGSNPESEIFLERCRADEIPVLRRRGGGCAVFLDPGNLIVSAALPAPGIGDIHALFSRCTQWLLFALNQMGDCTLDWDGVSDIVLGDKKVGGSCFYRCKGAGYFSASLLWQPDISAMETYLKYPPRTPDYRRGRAHSQFVTPLYPHLPFGRMFDFTFHLDAALAKGLDQLA